jgi:hypothetical protein
MSKLRCLLVLVVVLLAGRAVQGQYLAVFVDGRILPVASGRILDSSRLRLELSNGAHMDIPLARLDRFIEDAIEPQPEPAPAPSPGCVPGWVDDPLPEGTPFAREIREAARAANLHPRLVAEVVAAESAFKPYAVSRVGACGLMQLMPSVWLPAGIASPYVAADNLRVGARHLRALLDRFKELPLALAAYNAGAAVVERAGDVPPYRETRSYVRRVLERFCPATVENSAAEVARKPV